MFFRLHKFQSDIVRRVKDLHKIKYPGRSSINLDEAIDIMNRLTAEEASLTEDSVSVEQCLQNLTLTATPKFSQNTKPSFAPQFYNKFSQQNEGNNFSNQAKIARSGYNANNTIPVQQICPVCEGDDHNAGQCQNFPSPSEKKTELIRIGKCQYCGSKTNNNHRCFSYIQCKYCEGNHRSWLCTRRGQDIKNSK